MVGEWDDGKEMGGGHGEQASSPEPSPESGIELFSGRQTTLPAACLVGEKAGGF